MPEYAEVENERVIRVLELSASWDKDQVDKFLGSLSKNTWIKTTNKVGKGYEYHPELDIITPAKPYESWTLDEDKQEYVPPTPMPTGKIDRPPYEWDEETKTWILPNITY